MPYQRRTLSSAGLSVALFALGCADDGGLERNRGAAMVTEDDDAAREYVPPPEYTAAICQHAWSVATVTGLSCSSRQVVRCEDATLQSKLEAIASGCGVSLSEEAIELSMSGGCVTGLAVSPTSPANDVGVFNCLVSALGGVQAACSEQPDCIRLYGDVAPSDW